MKNTIIGVSGGMGDFSGTFRNGVSNDYFNSVILAGGSPLMIPVSTNKQAIEDIVELCDGIILTGGVDVNPRLYGEEISPKCGEISTLRDDYEMMLIDACMKYHKPIFGICRGIQILNVYFKGTLHQDVYMLDGTINHGQKGSRENGCHNVVLSDESQLIDVCGKVLDANSYHHQAIKKVGEGFIVTGKSSDGIVEVLEHTTLPIFAVQFHPEILASHHEQMLNIFKHFISVAQNKE